VSARCIELRNALVAAINNEVDLLPDGVTAQGKLYASLKVEDLLEAMQVVLVPSETAIERASRDAFQHDETVAIVLQVRYDNDAAAEAALLVYANVTDFLSGEGASLLCGKYELIELERAAAYDSQMATVSIARTIIKATYRSIGDD